MKQTVCIKKPGNKRVYRGTGWYNPIVTRCAERLGSWDHIPLSSDNLGSSREITMKYKQDRCDDVGSTRVSRGGGWYNVARYCRSAYRFGISPSNRYNSLGFRPARSR
jgi:formylglycine-generating enzyme required for sulfatase activity